LKDIPELTGIRFFAAFFVCAYHFSPNFNLPISSTLQNLARISVSLFFILSGFILCYTYYEKLDPKKLSQFFWSRFARLAPAFVIVMIAMIPIRLLFLLSSPATALSTYGLSIGLPIVGITWLANLFLVAVFIPILNPWLHFWNPPAWSITSEAVFYLTFPSVIFLLRKIKRANFLVLSAIGLYGLLCLGVVLLLLIIISINFEQFPSYFTQALYPGRRIMTEEMVRALTFEYFGYLLPFLHCFEFWIGCVTGCLFLKLMEQEELPRQNSRNLLLIISGILFYLASQASYLTQGLMGLGMYAAYAPSFVVLIFTLASGQTWVSKIFTHPWIVTLGKSSYALYISHFAIMAIHQNLANLGMIFPKIAYFILLGICLLVSLIIYNFVEVPTQKWLMKFGKTNFNFR
jgi:peptidoglycan/LPS O-acetylase OafA/YrhL